MQTQAAAGGGGGEEEQQQQAQEPDSRIHGRTPLSLMRLVAMQKSMGMLSSRPSVHSRALFWAPRGANWCSILHMLGGCWSLLFGVRTGEFEAPRKICVEFLCVLVLPNVLRCVLHLLGVEFEW